MAAKGKQKTELQTELKSQEQWDNAMDKLGLLVVDAYSAWCGPCKAIVSHFRRIKNEIGDDYLNFATAETDGIESLKLYRGKSRPTFLFYGSGTLVNVIRGCNGPLLERSIRSLLETEHKAIKGEGERVKFIDPEVKMSSEEKIDFGKVETSEIEQEGDEEIVEVPKEVTVAIIKPDAVREGKVDTILEKLAEAGIEVLHKEERMLTREEAAEFYKQQEGTEHFEQLIDFMSSGPCVTLVLSKEGDTAGHGVIPEFRNLLGPKDVNVAKEEAPSSLRAQFGTDQIQNAIHGCDSHESAARELAFFFPNFNVPTVTEKKKKKELQRTLALIRPSALSRKDSILRKIEEAGFIIAMAKEMHLTREQVEDFYSEHKEQPYFEHLVDNMTCGPSLALCLAREDAVEVWRNMLGPKDVAVAKNEAPESMRAVFADEEADINPIHGADSVQRADEEINKLFPKESTVAVIKPEVYNEPTQRELVISKIEEAGFNISAQKEVVLTKELAAQFYHEHSGKDFFNQLTDYMSSGPTLFLVLSREDAVDGFRSLMGPTDPDEAKASFPSSLRAQIAQDLMRNGVHGSSNREKARQIIAEYFPELEVKDEGLGETSPQENLAEVVVEHTEDDNLETKEETADQNNNTDPADETVQGQQVEVERNESLLPEVHNYGSVARNGSENNVTQPETDIEASAEDNDGKEMNENVANDDGQSNAEANKEEEYANETTDNNVDTPLTNGEQQSTEEAKTEIVNSNAGDVKTETEDGNAGDVKTKTEDGNAGDVKTETEDGNAGDVRTETEDGNAGEVKTEADDVNTGEVGGEAKEEGSDQTTPNKNDQSAS